LDLLTCKTVSQITYTVFVETLNPAHSLANSVQIVVKLNFVFEGNSVESDSEVLRHFSFSEMHENSRSQDIL